MTYEQSLQNIEKLKSLVLPINGQTVFFNFSSDTDFQVTFFDNRFDESLVEMCREYVSVDRPIGEIYENENGQETLYYADSIVDYEYNFVTASVRYSNSYLGFRYCPIQSALEMAKLFRQLKNM